MNKIKYQCKNCGWETSIREDWGDLRPKRCMNRKCNINFQASKDSLIITRPEKKAIEPVIMNEQSEKEDGKASRKRQKSSQSNEQ